MSLLEVAAMMLGSVVLATAVGKLGDLIINRKQRKDQVADKRETKSDKIEALREETTEQFVQMGGRLQMLETKVDKVAENSALTVALSKAQAYDRVRHLGMIYIKAGSITMEDLKRLMDLYGAYKALGDGDEFINKLMDNVQSLRIRIE